MAENDRKLSSFDEMGYDNSTKVLVPVIKYSDNTPQAIKENRNIPLELFYKHIFLKSEWVDYIINDPSWLRADTFSWHSGDSNEANSYVKVYDHLLNDIAGKSLISETIAGITIQYYLADDKHKICPASQESNLVSLYNTVGIAWYYLIDTENIRFKLPRTKFGFVGVRDNVGNYVEPTVPNITGGCDTGDRRTHIVGTSGAFYMRQVDSNLWAGMSSISGNTEGVGFDASLSNSTYKNGATVQQPATQMYLYFYVGEYTMSSLENIAGENTELFNGKLDTDNRNVDLGSGADAIIERQDPTAENNYTWYRKYASGWVEQGGKTSNFTNTSNATSDNKTVTLPVIMADTNYSVMITRAGSCAGWSYRELIALNKTTSVFVVGEWNNAGASGTTCYAIWEVKGMSAS